MNEKKITKYSYVKSVKVINYDDKRKIVVKKKKRYNIIDINND